ncbi:MAG: hypothetical protein E6868_19570 [Pantoea sp.]|uniref:hypothetical protein n=1 Tax=Pantoea TaxID=53335 RepID=UPI0028AF741E|nr:MULTISPECIES: hypothetical protein [Pantoea]MDU1575438.1 hypothetical protein [Pantoea sp.]
MPAGTITLTNNSATVTGSGTSFTTELKANDFIVAVVGGVTYTLGVQSVNSATSVTLTTAYGGPTTSGLAWNAVANAALVGITAQVAADVAKAIRGLNLDKANWQQVYSASGNITVTLPDGSQFTGPSWNSIVNSFSTKLDKNSNLSDVPDKAAARGNLGWVSGALPVTLGGTGATAAGTALSNLGYAINRSGNNIVRSSNGVIEMDFLIGATVAVGAFNAQTVGGITYYTHFYKFNLPQAMPNAILVALITLSGDRFGNQNPGYNADIKVSRDKDDGSGLLTSYLTVSVKSPQTGWFPYFNIRVVGY